MDELLAVSYIQLRYNSYVKEYVSPMILIVSLIIQYTLNKLQHVLVVPQQNQFQSFCKRLKLLVRYLANNFTFLKNIKDNFFCQIFK